METRNILLCGVGGQGTVLASKLLAQCAINRGLGAHTAETIGMAQRGGAVSTVVRFGPEVRSMRADAGCADFVVSFETTEALRNLPFLKEGGMLLVNDEAIKPLPVATGKAAMPQNARGVLADHGAVLIPAGRIARESGSPKSTNVVLLGAMAAGLPFSQDSWEEIIAAHVPPKTVDANIAAFRAGLAAARA